MLTAQSCLQKPSQLLYCFWTDLRSQCLGRRRKKPQPGWEWRPGCFKGVLGPVECGMGTAGPARLRQAGLLQAPEGGLGTREAGRGLVLAPEQP